jgi:hypothetical protein
LSASPGFTKKLVNGDTQPGLRTAERSDHEEKKGSEKGEGNIAMALADVPVDNKAERDDLRARLRQKYSELKPVKVRMNKEDRERFDELGEIMDALEECESRPPQKRPAC